MPGTSRSGRRPQPAAVRALKGSKTRPHHRGEPHYAAGIPSKPDFIAADALASARWDGLAPRLAQSGVLTEAHGEMLALLCLAWADLDRARVEFAEAGHKQMVCDETVNARGDVQRKYKINPIASRIEHQAAQVARFLGEFGLTPMTSSKVVAKVAVDVDPFAQFLDDDGDIYAARRTQ